MSERLENLVSRLLEVMESSVRKHPKRGSPHHVPLDYFSPAEPFESDWFREDLTDAYRDRGFFTGVTPRDLQEFDVRLLSKCDDSGRDWSLSRLRSQPLASARGSRLRSPWLAEWTIAILKQNKTHETARLLLNWSEGEWISVTSQKPFDREAQEQIGIQLSIAFTRYYEWTVSLRHEGGLGLLFVTDPAGARAAFRLRELPEGKNRRDALRNWIREHWRRLPRPEDQLHEVHVREHLRGRTEFRWSGLVCQINPSAYDLKRAETLRNREEQHKQQVRLWAYKRFGPQALTWK